MSLSSELLHYNVLHELYIVSKQPVLLSGSVDPSLPPDGSFPPHQNVVLQLRSEPRALSTGQNSSQFYPDSMGLAVKNNRPIHRAPFSEQEYTMCRRYLCKGVVQILEYLSHNQTIFFPSHLLPVPISPE